MAKQRGVAGWHSMRKDELVRALVKQAKAKARKSANGKTKSAKAAGKKPRSTKKPASKTTAKSPARKTPKPKRPTKLRLGKIQREQAERESRKNLATNGHGHTSHANGKRNGKHPVATRDRVVLMVRDPYWLHAHWELTRGCVDRARAALAEHWHTAKPVLRLIEVDGGGTTNTTERVARDIEIHGGVRNWYIDVADPPSSFVVEIGYLTAIGHFHSIARSNIVSTPRPGGSDGHDSNWSDVVENCEKIYAMSGGYSAEGRSGELQQLFEERLKRPMGSPMTTRYGMGAERYLNKQRTFELHVEAEMVVYGATKPDAYLTLGGEPVKVKPDGTFSVRMALGNQRQVLPIVAESADGVEQRTVVVAVERNTKVMEPVTRDSDEIER